MERQSHSFSLQDPESLHLFDYDGARAGDAMRHPDTRGLDSGRLGWLAHAGGVGAEASVRRLTHAVPVPTPKPERN